MKLALMKDLLVANVRSFFEKEDGDVNIVAIVFLIAIAVALALLFKEQVTGLIERLFGNINEKVDQFTE